MVNLSLHIIDDRFNPDPMTVRGTKDLVEAFLVLNRIPTPYPLTMTYPTSKPRKTKRP